MSSDQEKIIGGDLWWVQFKGFVLVVGIVFDYMNGIYEIVFFIMEFGNYQVGVVLDYLFCDGFRDLFFEWFIVGKLIIFSVVFVVVKLLNNYDICNISF